MAKQVFRKPVQPTTNPAPRHHGSDPVVKVLFWLLLVVAGACVLEFRGPYQGWLRRTVARWSGVEAEPAPPAAPPAEAPVPEAPPSATAEPTPPPPEKSPLEREYDALVSTIMKKLPVPELGKTYRVRLKDGGEIAGVLVNRRPGRISLGLKFGKMTLPVHLIHPSSQQQLFPERLAKTLALREIEKRQAQRRREMASASAAPATGSASVTAAPPPPKSAPTAKPAARKPEPQPEPDPEPHVASRELTYDPSRGKTPEALKIPVQEFGMWLRRQHQHLGGKIVNRVHAQRQGPAAVLYLEVHHNFLVQNYDLRYQIAESMWKFWSFRCEGSHRIAQLGDAHLVLVDSAGKIVGGSSAADGADIWVAKTSRPVTAHR